MPESDSDFYVFSPQIEVPEQIRILGKRFRVRLLAERDMPRDMMGQVDCLRQEILLRSDVAFDEQADTLMHEVIHAIDYVLSLGLKEEQVHRLAAGICAVLADNGQLTAWLTP